MTAPAAIWIAVKKCAWDVETGDETHSETVARGLALPENRSTEVTAMDVPVRSAGDEGRIVVAAYLLGHDGRQLARYVNWPEPLKYLHLQKPRHLRAELVDGATAVEIAAEVPVKGLALECEDDGGRADDGARAGVDDDVEAGDGRRGPDDGRRALQVPEPREAVDGVELGRAGVSARVGPAEEERRVRLGEREGEHARVDLSLGDERVEERGLGVRG